MMSIGTPISASGAKEYFKKDLENQLPDEVAQKLLNDETDDSEESDGGGSADVNEVGLIDPKQVILSGTLTAWQGELAEDFGLVGRVSQKDFNRLGDGRHPQTRALLIRHVKPRTKTNRSGKEFQTKSHRAGLDQTISAPKSVTLVAMKDARVIKAHLDASVKAIKVTEEATCAKLGNIKPPEQTGKALYAMFLHFEARPDGKTGHVAPELHTHFFEFNVARTADGKYRALEMRENYRSQKLATAVYRSELRREMIALGYEMRVDDKTGAPEVAGVSRAFIDANSPRQNEIIEKAQELKIKSTKIIAANYRQKKKDDKPEMIRRFEEMEKSFGFQAIETARAAKERASQLQPENKPVVVANKVGAAVDAKAKKAAEAMDFAVAEARLNNRLEKKDRKFVTRQSLLADALNFAATEITVRDIKEEFTSREKRGELAEFDLDRRQKSFASQKAAIAAGQNNYEKSIGTTVAAATTPAARHPRAEVSKLTVESNSVADLRNAPAISGSISGTGKTLVEKAEQKQTAESNFEESAVPLHCAARIGSAAHLGQIKNSGRRVLHTQRDGTIDQTNRSGQEADGDAATSGEGEAESGATDGAGKIRLGAESGRVSEAQTDPRKLATSGTERHSQKFGGAGTSRKKAGGISDIRRLVEKYQSRTGKATEHRESSGFGNADPEKRLSGERIAQLDESQLGTQGDGRFDSEAARKSQTRRSLIGKKTRAKMGVGEEVRHIFIDSGGAHGFHRLLPGDHRSEFDGRAGEAESGKRKSDESLSASGRKQKSNNAKLFGDDQHSENDFPDRQRLLQIKAGRAAKNHPKIDEQTNRAIAKKTAQIINVKFFAAQLDERITEEWTRTISKQPADRILFALLASEAKAEDRTLMAENLHRQTKGFAEDLELPMPALAAEQQQQREKLLAEKLTAIETKNYEAVTGEKVGAKTYEALVKKNLPSAEISVSAERHQEISESLKDLPVAPVFDSALEAETFAALVAPESFGCDEEQINLMRRNVERNETAAREAATLVQLAYGGQGDVSNDNFNRMLTDEIYYRSRSPVETYNYCAESSWQGMVKTFAPLVDNIAKQNQLMIISPANDAERNKLLADFTTQQIAEAYKSQHEPLFKWKEERLKVDYQESAIVQVNSSQQTEINKLSAENNLTAPKFSSSLEADAYRLSKYDDEKKSIYAEQKVSAVEEKVKAEAVKNVAVERENALVFSR